MHTLQEVVAVREAASARESRADLWSSVLMGDEPDLGLERLQSTGLLRETMPEVQAMVGFGGTGSGHKDLWGHTKLVVRQAKPCLSVRWAALFHDVGKVSTLSTETGKVSFHQHEFVSARLFSQAMRRTQLVDDQTFNEAHAIVRNLGLLEAYAPDWTDSAVRRLIRDLGEHFDRILMLARADITTKHAHKRERNDRRLDDLEQRSQALKAKDAIVPPLPKGLGDVLMTAFNIPPSKRLGDLRAALEKAVREGRVDAHRDSSYYVEFVSAHRDEFKL